MAVTRQVDLGRAEEGLLYRLSVAVRWEGGRVRGGWIESPLCRALCTDVARPAGESWEVPGWRGAQASCEDITAFRCKTVSYSLGTVTASYVSVHKWPSAECSVQGEGAPVSVDTCLQRGCRARGALPWPGSCDALHWRL